MKKVIGMCPDCGEEKELGPQTGICKRCSTRKSNCKHQGREYVKLKDVDPSKRVQRKTVTYTKRVNDETSFNKNETTKLYSKEIDEIVQKDIDFNLKSKNLKLPQSIDFGLAFTVLSNALDSANDIDKFFKAEEIFNDIENDYRHAYENAKTSEEFNYWSQVYKCFLDKRRQIKIVVSEFQSSGYIFKKLYEDNNFLLEFNTAYENYKNVHNFNEEGKYRQKSDSQIVKNADFCVGKKSETNYIGENKYNVLIRPNAPSSREPFKTTVYAKNEEIAKNKAIENMKKANYTMCYKRDNITVIKINADSDFGSVKEYL